MIKIKNEWNWKYGRSTKPQYNPSKTLLKSIKPVILLIKKEEKNIYSQYQKWKKENHYGFYRH
jgi:hypothetical protein